MIMIYAPMTKGSTCWPAQLYHGGRPAVYMVRLFDRIMPSHGLAVVVWLPIDVVRWRRPERRIGDSKADFAGTVVGEAGQQLSSVPIELASIKIGSVASERSSL